MSKKNKYTALSLFAGAGGMDLGFHTQGFQTIWANDIDRDSCDTHRRWSGAVVVNDDIAKIDSAMIPNADVILGGFPCQGFSLAGPRKIDDKRNSLYRHFVDLVEKKQPKAFVAENVKGLLTMGGGAIVQAIIDDFSKRGYEVRYQLLNAADYSVPQDRFRVIMVGIRKDLPYLFEFPKIDKIRFTLRDALSPLPKPKKDEICDAPYSPRFVSRNRRRDWDEVSFTIPAMAKQVAIHPASPVMIKKDKDLWVFSNEAKTRRFSWREAAVIQTFPADFIFEGNLTSKYKQIGNAVPVKLASRVAEQLNKALSNI